ncbi:Uncharacterised protein [Listeria grayi]|uniref:Uncharacterized protein n=1 Tax=Listeria grayi TaxID=1641 RepID=A0A378MNJ3_LISGR|nr:Uncharacterised protein [Listeria grayi]
MINKLIMTVLIIVVSIGAFTWPTSTKVEAAAKYKMITTVSANIRTSDNTKAKVIGSYKKGFVKTFTGKTKTIGIKHHTKVRPDMFQVSA